jgi:hypothetical protein
MAVAILGEDDRARNQQSPTVPKVVLPEHWHALPGLVDDPLLDEDAQVGILKLVDETGSATLEDLMAVLPDHPKPAKAVLLLVRLGILDIEPGLTDANSMLTRSFPRSAPARCADQGEAGGEGGSLRPMPEKGKLQRLRIVRPQPEIFFAQWTDRAVFRREPLLQRRGIYLALYCNTAYGGRSSRLADRLVDSNHLLQHGIPDLVIAAVDRNDLLTESQIRVAERLLVRAIEQDGTLKRANKMVPDGDHLDFASFAMVDRFIKDFVRSLREAGIAFVDRKGATARADQPRMAEHASPVKAPLPDADAPEQGLVHFSLHACGVHATAQRLEGKWTVLCGSQVRAQVLPSAGSGVAQRRQEALHDGSLVANGGHLLLARDLVFETASAAARFVVGTGHKGRIWRPLPKQPRMDDLYH